MKHRAYKVEHDSDGMPTKMVWIGDFERPTRKTVDRDRLAEHEKIYGKRAAGEGE